MDILCNIHIGETALSLQKATLIPGGSESLVYTTLSGTVGVLVPFTSREDHDFFQALEMHLRSENPPLCGRDHLAFRSFYFPVKVIYLTPSCVTEKKITFFLSFRVLLMAISASSSIRSTLANRKRSLMIWIERQTKCLRSSKTSEHDTRFNSFIVFIILICVIIHPHSQYVDVLIVFPN